MRLRKQVTLSLVEFIWYVMWSVMGIGLTTNKTIEYFKIDRPLGVCMERKDPVCHIDGKDLHIKYADNGDYAMSKQELK